MLHPLASLWRFPERVSFHRSGVLAGLVEREQMRAGLPAFAVRRRFGSLHDAEFYLRFWLANPAARAELRMMQQRAGPSLVGNYAGRDGWMYALAACLANGTIVVLEESPGLARPGRVVSAAPAATLSASQVAALPALSTAVASTVALSSVREDQQALQKVSEQDDVLASVKQAGVQEELDHVVCESVEDMLQAAQAETLEQAAGSGVPFCAVCKIVPTAPQPEEEAVVAVQAEALEQAAKQGVPFCEVCAGQLGVQVDPPMSGRDVEQTVPESSQDMLEGAQAEALEEAAEAGVPFCEACALAHREAANAAPPALDGERELPGTSVAEQVTQARVLEQASGTGQPFCEICAQQGTSKQEIEDG